MKKILPHSSLLFLLLSLPLLSASSESPAKSASDTASHMRAAYGGAVAFAGNDVIITENSGFSTPGMVHIIRRDGSGQWNEIQVLNSDDPFQGDGFGSAVAADEKTLFVAMFSKNETAGIVHVFEKNDQGLWERSQVIELEGVSQGDLFGTTMVVIGGHAVISAPGQDGGKGRLHTYMKSGDTWSMMDHIQPDGLSESAAYGSALSFRDGLLAVSAPGNGDGTGSIFTYRTMNGGHTWQQSGSVVYPEAGNTRQFGSVLLTDGERLFIGQPFADELNGLVRVFGTDATGAWTEEARLDLPATEGFQLRFGAALAQDGTDIWIAVPGASESTGAIYVYDSSDGQFKQTATIEYAEAQQPRARRSVLAIHEDIAVVGVKGRDYGEGIALILERSDGSWSEVRELYRDLGGYARVTGGQVDCEDGNAAGWDCENVDLISFLPNTELGAARGSRFNDVWGWTDPDTGSEYGILGHMEGAIFVDLTDPANPIVLGELPRTKGAPGSTHRDIKVYKNHAFIVADGARNHGMQIFDLTILRNVPDPPVVFEPTAMYTGIASAHNIVINEATGYAYTVGGSSGGETCGGALHMINIQDPLHPVFAGCFRDTNTGRGGSGATHDAQCVTYQGPDAEHVGKEICVGYNGTAVSIADVTDKDNPIAISTGTYPNSAYVHQGWFTDDHRFFYQNDEADENRGVVEKTRTMIWDVTDLDDPIMIAEFFGKESSTDHNLYVNGDLMYQTNNASGLRIIDIKDRARPVEVGFFDTTPGNLNVAGFDGTWSSYPYFESGIILISSRREGMFVVKKREIDT